MPSISTILLVEPWPAATRTFRRGTPNRSARYASSASFARPSCGGAATLIFRRSPSHPTISSRDARGTTLTASFDLFSASLIGSNHRSGRRDCSLPVSGRRGRPLDEHFAHVRRELSAHVLHLTFGHARRDHGAHGLENTRGLCPLELEPPREALFDRVAADLLVRPRRLPAQRRLQQGRKLRDQVFRLVRR